MSFSHSEELKKMEIKKKLRRELRLKMQIDLYVIDDVFNILFMKWF